jgi:hypothetical protein
MLHIWFFCRFAEQAWRFEDLDFVGGGKCSKSTGMVGAGAGTEYVLSQVGQGWYVVLTQATCQNGCYQTKY